MRAPPELILLTSFAGFLPLVVVVVLYSIILHHALRKVIQLKRATRNASGVGAVSSGAGSLRMHVGMASPTTSLASTARSGDSATDSSRKISAENNGTGTALSDTEEPLQPKGRKGLFHFLTR